MTAGKILGRRWAQALRWAGTAGLAAALAACGGGGGGGGGSVAGEGALRVALTDAPACGFQNVWVTVEKVRVHQSGTASDTDGGWTDLTINPARRVDLLELANGTLLELGTVPLAAGSYSQVRLVLATNSTTGTGTATIANAVLPTDGTVVPLSTPSGQQSGLKLQAHFDVAPGQTADLVLDFDACKSVIKAGNSGNYSLKPVISVVPRLASGIQGFVAKSLTAGSTTIAVQQNGVTVRSTSPDANGQFSIPFLSTGTYSLVIMSEGHATAVVTGVPAGTTTSAINGTATAITTPVSTMAEVTGTVVVSSVAGSSTVSTALTDATVRALQPLTGGPVLELGSQAVDSVLGSYRFRLPVAAPLKAAYVSTGPLVFSADTAAAGKYTVQAQAPGRTAQDKPADISTGTSAGANFSYGP